MRRRVLELVASASLAVLVTIAVAQEPSTPSEVKPELKVPEAVSAAGGPGAGATVNPLQALPSTTLPPAIDPTAKLTTGSVPGGVRSAVIVEKFDETTAPVPPGVYSQPRGVLERSGGGGGGISYAKVNGRNGQITYGYHVTGQPPSEIRELLEKWKQAKGKSDRDKVQQALQAALKEQFQGRLNANEKEIAQLEAEVQRLREQLELRRKKQDEIIDFRVSQLLREAQGLGWGTEPEMPADGMVSPPVRGYLAFPSDYAPNAIPGPSAR